MDLIQFSKVCHVSQWVYQNNVPGWNKTVYLPSHHVVCDTRLMCLQSQYGSLCNNLVHSSNSTWYTQNNASYKTLYFISTNCIRTILDTMMDGQLCKFSWVLSHFWKVFSFDYIVQSVCFSVWYRYAHSNWQSTGSMCICY